MEWLLFIVIGTIFFSLTTLLQRAFLKEEQSNYYAYAVAFQLLIALLIFIYVFFTGFNVPSFTSLPLNWGLVIFLYALANLAMFKGLQTIEASETSILISSRAIWTMFGAAIFLGEEVTLLRAVGVLLIIFGIAVIFHKGKKWKFNVGHLLILCSAALLGLAFTNDAFILKTVDAPSFAVFAFGLPGITLLLIKPKIIKELSYFLELKRAIKLLGASSLFSVAAVATYSSYRAGGDASQIMPIMQFSIIITVFLAYIFLGERGFVLKKIIGLLLALAGVLLIVF